MLWRLVIGSGARVTFNASAACVLSPPWLRNAWEGVYVLQVTLIALQLLFPHLMFLLQRKCSPHIFHPPRSPCAATQLM